MLKLRYSPHIFKEIESIKPCDSGFVIQFTQSQNQKIAIIMRKYCDTKSTCRLEEGRIGKRQSYKGQYCTNSFSSIKNEIPSLEHG